MENMTGPQGRIPDQNFSEWLKLYIPGTEVEATFPIPPEFREYFEDCLYPPSILFYARAVMDTTARLFNKSGAPDYSKIFPDKVAYPNSARRLREWVRLMEVVEVDRPNKRSRILKRAGELRCCGNLFWEQHSEWPDWTLQKPEDKAMDPMEAERWRRWAETRSHTALTLVKS
ncbi:MAG: hypothetical protein LBF40_02775 [Deltaproteobacteria bacterium]|jgi:hypothetical protein|nr:hypothetical protein [Deltaproteobacteria bacterium]